MGEKDQDVIHGALTSMENPVSYPIGLSVPEGPLRQAETTLAGKRAGETRKRPSLRIAGSGSDKIVRYVRGG